MASDGFAKFDLDAVKVDLEVALGSSTISTERIENPRQQV
jgi:hypothetical protein